jgi:hypothetical protein
VLYKAICLYYVKAKILPLSHLPIRYAIGATPNNHILSNAGRKDMNYWEISEKE